MAPKVNYEKFRDLFVTDISIQNALLATNSTDDFLEVAVMLAKDRGIELVAGELATMIVEYGQQPDSLDATGNPIPRPDESPICINLKKLANRPSGNSVTEVVNNLKATLETTDDPKKRICLW